MKSIEIRRVDGDVELEQQRLIDHDVIVFQHPVFWYSSPALLEEWQDGRMDTSYVSAARSRTEKLDQIMRSYRAADRHDTIDRDWVPPSKGDKKSG